jgi:hypothetical protein
MAKVNIKDIYYLGLTPSAESGSEQIHKQLSESLGKLAEKYPCTVLQNLARGAEENALESLGWAPSSAPLHITTALINGKATTKTKKSLEEFKLGVVENLNLNCLIIVEDMFIASLCKPKLIQANTKIPYLALWMNNSKAKDCSNVLEHILYKIKPAMNYGEEKLRTYYAICDKSVFKDDVFGEITINFDTYKNKKVWYVFIKDAVKVDFVSFIKNLEDK